MMYAPILKDESDRLSALQQYDLIDSGVDLGLDTVVTLARTLFQVPIATVSLVGEDKQFFLGAQGLDVCETGRDISFCAHAIGRPDVLVVPDARLDSRFADNPLVTGDPHIRFYAGVPLRAPTGHDIGTLCIIDRQPRAGFSDADQAMMRMLSTLVLENWSCAGSRSRANRASRGSRTSRRRRPTASSAPMTRASSPSGTPPPSGCSAMARRRLPAPAST